MSVSLRDKKVLVLEDEALLAFGLQDLLEAAGATVVGPVARIEAALALLQTEAIDVAILDLNIHGVASYAVADALAARGTPYLFASGYDKVSAAYAGHAAFLQKPYGEREVLAALEAMLVGEQTGSAPA